jgi:hypothetical protein
MRFWRTRRLAIALVPYGGFQDPEAGVPILDRNPYAADGERVSWVLAVFAFGSCCAAAFLMVDAFTHPSAGLFGLLPCVLVVSVALTYALIQKLFGREELWLDEQGLDYRWTDGLVCRRRVIPFPEIRRITRYSVMINGGEFRTPLPEFGLMIETVGRPLCLARSRDHEEVDELREKLEWYLRDRYATWVNAPECPDREVLDASGTRPEPPPDSALSCRREWDRTEFVVGHIHEQPFVLAGLAAALIGLGLVAMSGMSSYPVSALFAVIGLIAAGLVVLLSLAARRRWVVRAGEIAEFVGVRGLGWSRTTEIEWLDRIELRKVPGHAPRGTRFELALVDLDDDDKIVIGPLTEGEARWMAGIVADILRDALPRTGQEVYRWSVTVDPPAAGSRAMGDVWLDEVAADPGSKGSAMNKSG